MTDQSMIERVADAMAADNDSEEVFWTGDNATGWSLLARVSIQAMREPTPEMLAAAWDIVAPAKQTQGIARLGPGLAVADLWRAMIDAALATPSKVAASGGDGVVLHNEGITHD